jgi:hypothetical protein
MRVFNSYNIFLAIIEIPYTVAEQTIVTNRLVHLKFNFLENQIEIIPFEEFEDKYRRPEMCLQMTFLILHSH